MYNSIEIAKRIKEIAIKRGVVIKDMLLNCGLSKNALSSMLSGSMPKSENLGKIADYLNCSVDYLLGRTNELNEEMKLNENEIELLKLSEDQKRLLNMFSLLTEREKGEILGELKCMTKNKEIQENVS